MKFLKSFLFLLLLLFFFNSCGVPTLCNLKGISINKGSSSDNNNINISITGSDTDLYLLNNGPGLLLCYIISDNSSFTDTSTVIDSFKKSVVGKFFVEEDSVAFTYGSGNNKVYTFKNADNSNISSPVYCMNLGNFTVNNALNVKLILSYNKNDKQFILTDETHYAENKFISIDNNGQRYMHVFGAFSAEDGEFSNIYWSSMVYLGNIDLLAE